MPCNSIESMKRSDFLIALLIAIIAFALHAALAIRLNSYGVFDQYNVIFDADPNEEKSWFAHGYSLGGFNHPLLPYFFSIPIRVIAAIASKLGVINEEVVFREILALYIPPILSAIKAVSLFLAFRVLRLHTVDAAMATAIGVLSFSSLIFGSTPASYVVSGAGLALITLFSLLSCCGTSSLMKVGLALSGFFSIGTTVSNVIHYGWMTWMIPISEKRKPVPALTRSIAGAAILLLITLLLSWALGFVREGNVDHSRLMLSKEFVDHYKPSVSQQISNGARFPEMLARSFIPTVPLQKDNLLALQDGDPIEFELTFNGVEFGLGSAALWLSGIMILGGVVVSYHLGDLWRWAGFASVASLLTSGVLFSWFGTNTFLYSQYWQVPGAILIGAWVHFISVRFKIGRGLLAALALVFVIGDLYVLNVIDWALALP